MLGKKNPPRLVIACVLLPSQDSCPKLDLYKIKVKYKNKTERMLYVSGC